MSNCSYSALLGKPVKFPIDDEHHVNIVGMMSRDVVELQKKHAELKSSEAEQFADVVSRCVVDDIGKPLMSYEEALRLSPGMLGNLFVECAKVSGFGTKDEPPKN